MLIETSLHLRPTVHQQGESNLTLHAGLAKATLDLYLPGGMPFAGPVSRTSREDALPIIAELWREGAILYLNTVLSENLPSKYIPYSRSIHILSAA